MAEDKKVTISRTLNGDKIYYIARNSGGVIFARTLKLKDLEEAIKIYKEPPKEEASIEAVSSGQAGSGEPKKKYLVNRLLGKVQEARRKRQEEKTPATEQPTSPEPKQVTNELQEQVVQKRKGSRRSSFWDKLK